MRNHRPEMVRDLDLDVRPTAELPSLDNSVRTQIAYLANALASYPERHASLLRIAEAEGSIPVSVVVRKLRENLSTQQHEDEGAIRERLSEIAADFVKQADPVGYAGLALEGSLDSWRAADDEPAR